jgi:copper chaperone CopZ
MSKLALTGMLTGVAAAWAGTTVCPFCGDGREAAAQPVITVTAQSDTVEAKLAIRGMTCGSCATTARIALERVPGVFYARVSYDSSSAVVAYDPARTSPEAFITRLKDMTGYEARLVDPPGERKPDRQ